MSKIDELRGLVERATRGPWVEREALKATAGGIRTERDIFGAGGDRVLLNLSEADRLLIVAAVNALPALLAVAEAARKVVQHTADFDLETALARLDGEVG